MVRTLQWVAALGLRASVLVISSATASSSTVRGLPVRISSYSPSIRSAMKRLRHLPIVWGPTPSRVATTALLGSRSQASTIFARNVSAAGSERERVIANRCARSSLDIVSNAFGRPVRIGYLLDQDTRNLCNNYATNLRDRTLQSSPERVKPARITRKAASDSSYPEKR